MHDDTTAVHKRLVTLSPFMYITCRLVEQADFDAARELFGASGKPLEAFLPRDAKDFEDFAAEVVNR